MTVYFTCYSFNYSFISGFFFFFFCLIIFLKIFHFILFSFYNSSFQNKIWDWWQCISTASFGSLTLSSYHCLSNSIPLIYGSIMTIVKIFWNLKLLTRNNLNKIITKPVSWGCRICWLHLCRVVRSHQQVSLIWHQIASRSEVPVLELWGMITHYCNYSQVHSETEWWYLYRSMGKIELVSWIWH